MSKIQERLRRFKMPRISLRDALVIWLPSILIIVAAFWIAYQFVSPAPPSHFVMSTGPVDGAYQQVGLRYQEFLSRYGINLELRPSAGAVENLERLEDDNSDVAMGLVQSGTGTEHDYPDLVSLGSVYYEPVWIFYRGAPIEDQLHRLKGKRIALGPQGSGTRKLATQLLLVNDAWTPQGISDLGGDAAAAALQKGQLDAVVLIGPAATHSIHTLLLDPNVRLLSFDRAEAYTKAFPFLSKVMLPEGGIDLVKNIPPRDVTLLSPTANVVIADGLHPALVDLVMQAMTEVHKDAGVFEAAGQFPSPPKASEFPLDDEAERYFKSGPPFLQRYMPFWAANFLNRALIFLVPLFAVLIPVVRIAPGLYSYRIRSRIYRWYGELKFLEFELRDHYDASRAEIYLKKLNDLEDRANAKPTPRAFVAEVYTLRQHIDMVRHLLRGKASGE